MSGLSYIETEYWIHSKHFPTAKKEARLIKVKGYQIGRFGVRTEIDPDDPEKHVEHHPSPGGKGDWRIEHIPTGAFIFSTDDFDTAIAIADDLSRFSAKDPASKDPKVAMRQIGQPVRIWMRDQVNPHGYMPFRDWVESKGAQWHPRSRRWKKRL
jgi:hypothetical protein